MREEDYFRNQEQVAVRQQVVEAVSDGIKAPDAFLRASALYRGEDRTVEYLVLPSLLVQPIEEPAPDTLAAWFEQRRAQYAAPEFRKIRYLRLNPDDIADESSVSDEDVRKDYEANRDRYTTPEERTIEQLVFPDQASAEAALAAIRGGETFEQAVAAQSKSIADVQLGKLTKDAVSDKAVADAAFALGPNEVSPVVSGAFGPVLLRVTAITPGKVEELDAVAPQIKRELALGEASRVLLDVHDAYEDARAGGASLEEAADSLKLKVQLVDAIDRSGRTPDGTVVDNLPASRELIAAAFEAEPNTDNEALPTAENGYVFFEVESVTPARDRTLDEVREKVVSDWKAEQSRERLIARADELQKRVNDRSTTIDALAAELKLEKQTKRGLKRGADDGDFGAAGVSAVFSVAADQASTVPTPAGDAQIVFKVTEVFEPAAATPEAIPEQQRSQLSVAIGNDVLEQMIAELQSQYPVSVNQTALAQALGN